MHRHLLAALGLIALSIPACKDKELDAGGGEKGDACDPDATDREGTCADGLSCSPSASSPDDFVCAPPYLLRGLVHDALDGAPIEAARVLALDVTSAPVTDVAETDADGRYELEVPVPRDEAGDPVEGVKFTLMASAADYQPFPAGVRPAIPVDIADAEPEDGDDEDDEPDYDVVENATTEIAMIPLAADEHGGARIEGDVLSDQAAGTLVVAEGLAGSPRSTVADHSGHYVLFNVPDGTAHIAGYRAGLQVEPVDVEIAGDDVTGVDLSVGDAALASVSGSVQIVNAFGGAATSVVLVPVSVYNETLERGPVPFGLRAPEPGIPPSISGPFSIDGVPHGTYKVLAAFENDELVRDPDEGISGTQIVEIIVDHGGEVSIDAGFKITEALEVFSPGADEPEVVGDLPTFVFADDSSEDLYHVVVFDALGELIWEDDAVPGVSGDAQVSVPYAGPALEPGMYYQFRATSKRDKMGEITSISRTEDLRGVFVIGNE
jgi:hypothetical protein